MKKTSKIISVLICIAMLFVSAIPAFADTTDQATLDARNGVVKVLVYYNNHTFPETMGTGFLINEDTIITSATLVKEKESTKVTKVTVVAVADIEIPANKLSVSGERDFAVLKLEQKINQRAILPLGTPNGFDTTASVYALGFPIIKEYTSSAINYSPTDVVVTEGAVSSISNISNVKYIQHSAKLDRGNFGGPLVYSDGMTASVVGVNVDMTSETGSTYYYSIHIDEVIEALDTLGIEYTPIGTVTNPTTSAEDTTEAEKTVAKTSPLKNIDKKVIIGVLAGVLVAAIAVVIIIVVSSKKKAPVASRPQSFGSMSQSNGPSTMTGNGPSSGADSTTVLKHNVPSGDPNATTVLGSNSNPAYLIRISNNEKISITKSLFKIGKDSSRVDYCINGNSAISRFHAAIISRDGKYYIEDQSSTNHTYVNDSMIPAKAETQLSNGAIIKLADEKFEFRI
ncbi:MAG: trypsin-like peptidase domain-containing protein [Eubacteriales bacterium]|nr:trypsin-like peptidase domain-containing protein [Eubacteriales bacterium]